MQVLHVFLVILLLINLLLITLISSHNSFPQLITVATITPPKWNLKFLFAMAGVQAAVAMVSSLILLYILLVSWDENSFLNVIGIGGVGYGKITSAIYLKVSVSDFLTLFSARAGGDWFFVSRPANVLFMGAFTALTASTLISMFWPDSKVRANA